MSKLIKETSRLTRGLFFLGNDIKSVQEFIERTARNKNDDKLLEHFT